MNSRQVDHEFFFFFVSFLRTLDQNILKSYLAVDTSSMKKWEKNWKLNPTTHKFCVKIFQHENCFQSTRVSRAFHACKNRKIESEKWKMWLGGMLWVGLAWTLNRRDMEIEF